MRRALLLGLLLSCAVPGTAAALSVAPVPANPNSACAAGNPCSLDHALQIASPGDDITIPPGAYSLTYQRNLQGVNVHGIDGEDAPQITESGAYFALSGGELRRVGVVQTSASGSTGTSLAGGATAEDVTVRCVNACSAVLELASAASVKDAVITGPMSVNGIEVTGTTVLRNLTVLVGGANSLGVKAYTNNNDTAVDLRNSIVRGVQDDLAFVQIGGSVATLTYGWSDVRAGSQFLNGGAITDLGHDVREEPIRIADIAGGDAHLRPDSTLIDAGTNDALGTFDIDGGARLLGSAPDIGADEAYFAPPLADTGETTAIDTTSATIAGVVTPDGQPTTYRFEWGTTTGYGQATADATAGNGSQAVPVSTALTGLVPDTVYHYRVVATSAYGTAAGIDRVLRTAAVPAPTPPPPFTGAFVRARSTRIDKRGRLNVTLTCPATAITTCAGTARLGLPLAKPVAFSARSGATTPVHLTLTRVGRRLVGPKGLHTSLVVLATDSAGREHAQVTGLLIRRPKPRR